MTAPRRLVPGQTHTVTRRVFRRTLLLRPVPAINQLVLYALGVALERRPGLALHATLVESTHHHDCLTDAAGASALPDFYRDWHSLVARALNAHYGRGENFWRAGSSYDNVEVHGGNHTLEEQLLYLWTNPVKDGLVPRPEHWPGLKFLPEDFGRTIVVDRPAATFFGGVLPADFAPTDPEARRAWANERRRELELARARQRAADRSRGRTGRRARTLADERARRAEREAQRPRRVRTRLPDQVTITIARPPGYGHLSLDEVRGHFRRLLDARVAEIHRQRQEAGLTHFVGVEAILAQDPRTSLGDGFPSFETNPRIACRDPVDRPALLAELVAWRKTYREALEAWRGGGRSAAFPQGSYWLPRFHGARLATGPPLAA